MKTKTKDRLSLKVAAAMTAGMLLSSGDAMAVGKFEDATDNIVQASSNIPNLVSTVAYIAGIGLGVLGILKLKGHVDNPGNVPLKEGLVRLGAGGGLLAMPFVLEAMINAIGDSSGGADFDKISDAMQPITVP